MQNLIVCHVICWSIKDVVDRMRKIKRCSKKSRSLLGLSVPPLLVNNIQTDFFSLPIFIDFFLKGLVSFPAHFPCIVCPCFGENFKCLFGGGSANGFLWASLIPKYWLFLGWADPNPSWIAGCDCSVNTFFKTDWVDLSPSSDRISDWLQNPDHVKPPKKRLLKGNSSIML